MVTDTTTPKGKKRTQVNYNEMLTLHNHTHQEIDMLQEDVTKRDFVLCNFEQGSMRPVYKCEQSIHSNL